jgi:ferredoxin
MRVTIDREECIQCGSCSNICPLFFEPDQDERSQVVAQYRTDSNLGAGDAPDKLSDCVTEAADACPVSVIHLEAPKGVHSYGP